jgi:lipopolysaccharide biosynthesis regulator YciM
MPLDPATERQLGVDLFNHAWTLLRLDERTPEQVDELIHSAHASRLHWMAVGTAVHACRGEWQCSRVYAVLGRAEPALWHARRALELCEQAAAEGSAEDFDLPFCFEALARAHAVAGDPAEARRWLERAHEAAASVAEDDDRELLLSDLATISA